MKKLTKIFCSLAAAGVLTLAALPLSGCANGEDELVLRVSNWEEYIDLGGWDEDEKIDIGEDGIIGENSMVDDFTDWFNSTHDYKVKVQYSTFGTNEDLYNRLNLGDTYDLVCPSDYLLMQLIKENKAEPYSDDFYNSEKEENYYINNVSPYIKGIFSNNKVTLNGTDEEVSWERYAACYMWGTSGIVYNPAPGQVDEDDVTSWEILRNKKYAKRITIKDNVRDAYFAALGIHAGELFEDGETVDLEELMNKPNDTTIGAAEDILKQIKENVYSFETDSGKADMITGKIAANFQWSGDAVFIMDEAEYDEQSPTSLWYSIPDECTNLWFDGWVMLKSGINGDARKKEAAEAFVNFLSRPDNAVRNMYYIGYTSSITGGLVYDYIKYNYDALENMEDGDEIDELYYYDLNHLFKGENDPEDYFIYIDLTEGNEQIRIDKETTPHSVEEIDEGQYTVYHNAHIGRGRQAFTQYPPEEVTERSIVMRDFGAKLADINQMWINVRCLDVKDFRPAVVWSVVGIVLAGAVAIALYKFRYKIFYRRKKAIA